MRKTYTILQYAHRIQKNHGKNGIVIIFAQILCGFIREEVKLKQSIDWMVGTGFFF